MATPAFPTTRYYDEEPIGVAEGMTLRDYFAAKALVGLIEGYDHEARVASIDPKKRTGLDDNPNKDSNSTYASQMAEEAYMIADAMLAERKKGK